MTVDHAGLPSGDAMTDRADPAELLDIDMDEFAWILTLVAANRFRLQGAELIQAQPTQNAADGRWRYAGLGSDLLAGPALAAQPLDRSTTA